MHDASRMAQEETEVFAWSGGSKDILVEGISGKRRVIKGKLKIWISIRILKGAHMDKPCFLTEADCNACSPKKHLKNVVNKFYKTCKECHVILCLFRHCAMKWPCFQMQIII